MAEELKQEAYQTHFANPGDMSTWVGKELGLSPWMSIAQDRINAFADATEDHQWIHIDPEKSAKLSPYGKTIAHGYLVLSLAPKFVSEALSMDGIKMGINYGLDRVRFPNATLVDSRIRGRVSLLDYERQAGGSKYKIQVVFELEGQEKPACVAELLGLVFHD